MYFLSAFSLKLLVPEYSFVYIPFRKSPFLFLFLLDIDNLLSLVSCFDFYFLYLVSHDWLHLFFNSPVPHLLNQPLCI